VIRRGYTQDPGREIAVLLEGEIKPLVEQFLQERGLELSPAKTVITHVEKGFDFLGQNVRKYPNGKLLIKPSKKNIKIFLGGIRKCCSLGRYSSEIRTGCANKRPSGFAGCLPRPNSVAGCPVTWLSPRFIGNIQPSDY
jgi:hypothetical protein